MQKQFIVLSLVTVGIAASSAVGEGPVKSPATTPATSPSATSVTKSASAPSALKGDGALTMLSEGAAKEPTKSPSSASPAKSLAPAAKVETPSALKGDIAIIDVYKVAAKLEEYQDEEKAMRSEDESKRRQLEMLSMELRKLQEELQGMGTTIKPSVREAKIERARELQKTIEIKAQSHDEYRQRKAQEIQMRLFKQIEEIAEEIRKEQGLKMIFAGGAICYDASIDLSDSVATRMNLAYGHKKVRQEKPIAAKLELASAK